MIKKMVVVVMAVLLTAMAGWAGGRPESAQPITLRVWHQWPNVSTDPQKADFDAAVAEWNKANPNIKIEVDTVTNDQYKPKIQTALSGNEAPDVFFIFGGAFAQPFVESGKLLALDPYLDQGYRDKLLRAVLTYITFNGKTYGLPTGMDTAWLFVNRELFQKNNVAYPKTFGDLVSAVKVFRQAGLTPIALGNKERWPIILLYESLAVRHGGQQAVVDALRNKKMALPAFLEAAQDLKTLVDAGAFRPDVVGVSMFGEGLLEFTQGKSPMLYHGSWIGGALEAPDAAIKGKVDVVRFPAVSGGAGSELDTWGGPFAFFAVNSQSKHAKEAVEFLKSVVYRKNYYSYLSGSSMPAYNVSVDPSKIKSDINKSIIKNLGDVKSLTIGWDLLLDQNAAQNYLDNISAVLGGKMTPDQFAKALASD